MGLMKTRPARDLTAAQLWARPERLRGECACSATPSSVASCGRRWSTPALPSGRRPKTFSGGPLSSLAATMRGRSSPRSTSSSRRCAPGPRLVRARTKQAPGGALRRPPAAKSCPKARDKAILVRLSSHWEHLARLKRPPKQADMPAEKAQIRTKRTKVALQLVGNWAAG